MPINITHSLICWLVTLPKALETMFESALLKIITKTLNKTSRYLLLHMLAVMQLEFHQDVLKLSKLLHTYIHIQSYIAPKS